MEIIYEPYTYDELREHMDENGQVEALVEVDQMFADELSITAEQELRGYVDAGEMLYEELAEKVIGNQWCHNGLYWEPADEPAAYDGNVVIKVIIEPDLD